MTIRMQNDCTTRGTILIDLQLCDDMTDKTPPNAENDGRIVPFKPRVRPRLQAFSNLMADRSPVEDVSKYAQAGDDRSEYAHRMKMNALAVVFLAALVGGGIWIVDLMAQQRKNQDCALSGRRNCASVTVPVNER
jgi:hypothetical protein